MAGSISPFKEADLTAALEIIATSPQADLKKITIPKNLPSLSTLQRKARFDPVFADRLRLAIDARKQHPDYHPLRYTDKQYDQAIAYLKTRSNIPLQRAMAERPAHFPSLSALQYHAAKNPDFAARLGQHIASRLPTIRTHVESGLMRSLSRNDLYLKASRAIPHFDPQAREDLKQELIVAVLEGRLTEEALAGGFQSFRKKLKQTSHPLDFVSLDEPRRGVEKNPESLVDTLTSDNFYEAA